MDFPKRITKAYRKAVQAVTYETRMTGHNISTNPKGQPIETKHKQPIVQLNKIWGHLNTKNSNTCSSSHKQITQHYMEIKPRPRPFH